MYVLMYDQLWKVIAFTNRQRSNQHPPGNDHFVLTHAHMLVCPHTSTHNTHATTNKRACVYCTPLLSVPNLESALVPTEGSQAWSRLKKSSTLTICSFGACSENSFPQYRRAGQIFIKFIYLFSPLFSITTLHIKECTESSENKGLHRVKMLMPCLGSVVYFLSFSCLSQAFELHRRPPLITQLGFFSLSNLSHLFKHDLLHFLKKFFCFVKVQICFQPHRFISIHIIRVIEYMLQAV